MEFDQRFDRGEDVTSVLDLDQVRRPGTEQRRVNADFPAWMVESLGRGGRAIWRHSLWDHTRNPSIAEV